MQGKRIDITGQRFGMVVVRSYHHTDPHGGGTAYWLCHCDCGRDFITRGQSLRRGLTKSCGCRKRQILSESRRTHGETETRFYKIWTGIKTRATNPNCKAYSRYGGRDVGICYRWLDFNNFRADMLQSYLEHCLIYSEKNTTIDRKDTNAGYSPDNCKWSTYEEQNNNRRDNMKIEYNGATYLILQAARLFHLKASTLRFRLRRGWSVERALTTPARKLINHREVVN